MNERILLKLGGPVQVTVRPLGLHIDGALLGVDVKVAAVLEAAADIGQQLVLKGPPPDEEALCALRDLYQQARYSGEVSREDYQRFRRLERRVSTLKVFASRSSLSR